MKKVHLLIIDPQNDFCDPSGALYVAGADKDMERLAKFIRSKGHLFEDISCTVDSHQTVHIAHPIFWIDSKGKHPSPFTQITADDVRNGRWTTKNPGWHALGLNYVEQLEKHGRYQLFIWPPHCIIGSRGHGLVPAVSDALIEWETRNFAGVDYVTKGSNFATEHYSAVQADVPDDNDASTKLNTDLIARLSNADEILITGEALSHCVANTVTDIANTFGDDNIKKFVLLTDTSSNVTSLEFLGQKFVSDMIARGMRTTRTTEW